MDPVVTTLVILALAIVAFMSNRVPLGIVAVALWITGITRSPCGLLLLFLVVAVFYVPLIWPF